MDPEINNIIDRMVNNVVNKISLGLLPDMETAMSSIIFIAVLMTGFYILMEIISPEKKVNKNGTKMLGSGTFNSEIKWGYPDRKITENAGLIDRHGANEENGKAPAAGTSSSGWYMG